MNKLACSLTIAGTDPTGGAGIQADLKTFQEFKSYGMSIITTVLAQNTTGVQNVHHVPITMIEQQLDSVWNDVPVHAFKTGMIATIDMMELIHYKVAHVTVPFIMDPVMISTSGDPLIADDARDFLRDQLLPLATVVTPNIQEAEALLEQSIQTKEEMKNAAVSIVKLLGAEAALVKGGHLKEDAVDILYDGEQIHHFSAPRINTNNTHGTGCTLSAAITACMSKGMSLPTAVQIAKNYVTAAIKQSFSIGHGNGPTNHWATRSSEVLL